MGKRIVIALGGNALGKNLPEQMEAVQHTARAIVDLIEQGNEVIVVHGNGPQVGICLLYTSPAISSKTTARDKRPPLAPPFLPPARLGIVCEPCGIYVPGAPRAGTP